MQLRLNLVCGVTQPVSEGRTLWNSRESPGKKAESSACPRTSANFASVSVLPIPLHPRIHPPYKLHPLTPRLQLIPQILDSVLASTHRSTRSETYTYPRHPSLRSGVPLGCHSLPNAKTSPASCPARVIAHRTRSIRPGHHQNLLSIHRHR